jgi:O-antigen/teichoic acid export membrane protein
MTLQQRAIKGVVWTSLQNWGGQALSTITFLILTRLLTPESFGLIALASIFVQLVQALIVQGFSDAIVQRKDLEPEHLDTAFWFNLGISLLMLGIGVTTADLIAQAFRQPELAPVIQWLALMIVLAGLSTTQQALLRRQLNFKLLAARQLTGQSIGCIVSIVMAFQGFGVWSLVSQLLVGNLISTILLWKISGWRPGFKISIKHFKDLFSFGINIVGISFLSFISMRADDFLIGYFLGPVVLGYYTVAYRLLVTLIQLLTDTVRQVILPTFSRMQDDLGKMRQAYYSAGELVSFAALPSFLGMAILAPELVRGLFGSQWEPSIPVMQILALMGLLLTIFNFSGAVFMAMGKPSWALWLLLLDTIARVIAFSVAVKWGIIAVAAGLVISGYLLSPVRLWAVRKLIHLSIADYMGRFIPPLVSSGVMVAVIWLFKYFFANSLNVSVLLGICIGLGAIAYLLTIFLLFPKFFKKLLNVARLATPSKMPKPEPPKI